MSSGTGDDERGGGAEDWARFQEPHFRPFYDAVHARLNITNGTRLLDVGCGTGGAALLAAQRGAQVVGLDASAPSIELASARVPQGDFRVGDMEQLPWPAGAFDAVTGFNVFQFARHPTTALAEARRMLARGGRLGLVIWAPHDQSQQATLMDAMGALAPAQPPDAPGPFALSAPGMAEAALQSAGLRLVDRGEAPIVVEYPDAEAACRAMLQGSAGKRAVQHSGEARVREVLLDGLAAYRTETGGYRLENRYRFLIADTAES
jgi:SAM-dependent methyltransferase